MPFMATPSFYGYCTSSKKLKNYTIMKKIPIFLILVSALILTASCSSIPEKAEPVTNFQKDRYLGTWYEIARFDFKHERNMNNTIAQYSLNDDGSIRVLNSGYNYKEQKWKQAEGKAKFRGDETVEIGRASCRERVENEEGDEKEERHRVEIKD